MNQEKWLRLESIFDRILKVEPGERARHLDRACGSDSELREELDRMLDAHARAESRQLFEQPAWGFNPDSLRHDMSNRDPMIGKVVGGIFRIREKLGEGGFGDVYLASGNVGSRDAGQFVIKFARNQDDDQRRRFQEEVRINAELKHENIAPINYWGELEGRQYLVVEYIKGQNLGNFIEYKRTDRLGLDPRLVGEITRQAGAAIQFAHDRGVIHRDIKPQNIMILESDGKIIVKVIDFGLAKSNEAITRRATSGIIGSLNYISPEQLNADKDQYPGCACDVYAMGLVIYEMLTGRIAINALSQGALIKKQLEYIPPPPGISRAVDRVVMTALKKNPKARQKSVAELTADLSEAIAELYNETKPHPIRKLRQSALISAAMLLLLSGAGIGWYFNQPAPGIVSSPPVTAVAPKPIPTLSGSKLMVFKNRSSTGPGEMVENSNENVFTKNDFLRFKVESPVNGYFYLIQRGTKNDLTLLYPNPDIPNYSVNTIKGQTPIFVPPVDDNGFRFDGVPGVETIYALFVKEKSARLAGIIEAEILRKDKNLNSLGQLLLDEKIEIMLQKAMSEPIDEISSVSRIELRHQR